MNDDEKLAEIKVKFSKLLSDYKLEKVESYQNLERIIPLIIKFQKNALTMELQ